MAVKILIKRRFKEGHFNEINRMLKKVRYGAMDEDGYLSSETLWDHEDPFRVVGVPWERAPARGRSCVERGWRLTAGPPRAT